MHHELHSLLVRIVIESLDVEIRIWSNEVEYIILIAVRLVFPTFVPSLYKYLIETVLCCEVDVTAHLLVVGRVTSVRSCRRIIGLAELH